MPKSISKHLPGNYERLIQLDKIISDADGYLGRDILLSKINQLLPAEEKVEIVTIDKDIKKIRELLAESNPNVLLKNTQAKGYYYSQRGFRLFDNPIDLDDKPALIIARELLQSLHGSVLQPKFEELVQKIMSLAVDADDMPSIQEPVGSYIRVSDQTPDPGIQWIEPLIKAILNKDALLINYQSRNKAPKDRHISPYLLKQYLNRWYLVAYDHLSAYESKVLVFALANINSCQFSNKPYISPDINIREYFRHSIGIWHDHRDKPMLVKLRFYKQMDFVKSNPLHHTQQILSENEENHLDISIEVFPGPELDRLVLGFGNMVKVFDPQSLKDHIASKISEMVKMYL
jgi:predicted DNA-binding transcriptional regulator YafY